MREPTDRLPAVAGALIMLLAWGAPGTSRAGGLGATFYATLSNASQTGDKCLIFNRNGTEDSPSRYLWGGGNNGYCGFGSLKELLANKQAVFKFTSLGDGRYIITNASRTGTDECLIFGENGGAAHPSRYLWGGGDNGYCGFNSLHELLANRQAVWNVNLISGNQYTLTNSSRSPRECLIFSGNGGETYPTRYLWGGGDNGYCGLPTAAELVSNGQGVWRITVLP
jgi:hypothetical protein